MDSPIPPSTLSQAGTLAVATSSAWDSKAMMSAWWVNAVEVSKIASSGEYLTAGSFAIKGPKKFLPPTQLLLGFGVFFKVSDESKARHLKHRLQDDRNILSTTRATVGETDTGVEERQMQNVESAGDEPEDFSDQSNHNKDEHVEIKVVAGLDESDGNLEYDHQESNDIERLQSNPVPHGNNEKHTSQSETQGMVSYSIDSLPKVSDISADDEHQDKTQVEDKALGGDNRKQQLSAARRDSRECPRVAPDEFSEVSSGSSPSEKTRMSSPTVSEHPNLSGQSTDMLQLPAVRGKHGKRNKFKTKYAEQDEDDRALAMRLLGSTAAQEKAAEEAANKAAKSQELAEQKERRRQQHALIAEKGKEAEKFRRVDFEESIEASDDREIDGMDDLDAFIGSPLPGDEILDVLVVCGPWDAIGSRCKWKVKLQPGSTKKGKAVREIFHIWMSATKDQEGKDRPIIGEGNECMAEEEKAREREAELIRAVREPEVIGIIPVGKVRVVAGGRGGGSGVKGRAGGAGRGRRGGKGSKSQR